jgi:hypothetical protein
MSYFYLSQLSKAVTDLENSISETLAELREHPEALSTLKSESANIQYALNKINRAIAKAGCGNASDSGAGVLI